MGLQRPISESGWSHLFALFFGLGFIGCGVGKIRTSKDTSDDKKCTGKGEFAGSFGDSI